MSNRGVWHTLRWAPVTFMLVVAAVLLGMMLRGGMFRVAAWQLAREVPPLLGFISLLALLVYAIRQRRWSRPMSTMLLVSLFSMLPVLLFVVPVAYPASLDSTTPSATVRLPADGPLKVAWGGDTTDVNYHVVAPDQRWAYDLLVEPYLTGSTELADYGCYGIPVLAPAPGYVVAAHDGEPDMTPGATSNNFQAPLGNYVAIRLESDTYLLLAHLRPGSVRVQAGERVAEGEVVGECGNSGNTSEPHIHIHHQRQDPTEFPLNFAEGLPLYFRDHDGPPMPRGGIRVEDGKPVATGDTVQHAGP